MSIKKELSVSKEMKGKNFFLLKKYRDCDLIEVYFYRDFKLGTETFCWLYYTDEPIVMRYRNHQGKEWYFVDKSVLGYRCIYKHVAEFIGREPVESDNVKLIKITS